MAKTLFLLKNYAYFDCFFCLKKKLKKKNQNKRNLLLKKWAFNFFIQFENKSFFATLFKILKNCWTKKNIRMGLELILLHHKRKA